MRVSATCPVAHIALAAAGIVFAGFGAGAAFAGGMSGAWAVSLPIATANGEGNPWGVVTANGEGNPWG